WPIKQPTNKVIVTYIGLACQEEILINFEFLLIDNLISNFINISCCQTDVNNYFQLFCQTISTALNCFDNDNYYTWILPTRQHLFSTFLIYFLNLNFFII
ncbi:hypothetical protein ACLUYL_04900, partial [Limosilactobacillus reuteri subsp. suis]|uniref:hypothetical protein n=2 Tax=Limosilactobacillus reuteri TaxID=1598 RepID=UPI0039948DDE